jgi:hypothetical protein
MTFVGDDIALEPLVSAHKRSNSGVLWPQILHDLGRGGEGVSVKPRQLGG